MKYDFVCKSCAVVATLEMPVREFSEKKNSQVCACGAPLEFKFDARSLDFCFAGDAWADKNYREKEYRKRRSAYMAKRQAANTRATKLVPNYKGEVAGSWKDAKDAAVGEGKDTTVYDKLIQKESKGA